MKTISAEEVKSLLEKGEQLHLIDVREAKEVAEGKIPTACHIPLGLLEFRLQDLDKTKEYIIVCRSGGRSAQAALFLEHRGFKVINMDGGMLAWEGDVE
ncbi:rhodanese-like domain-containing protein [Peribacillus asahii]|uniref:Rhodanese-like domain-containing protein n=1 Tax=Peribacillus asahii TaxID=228899 RepID=A0A398AX98_9BACI|nr:rhodanese-like domain-containing protein [Peribacillus asahii]RID82191.1 rhodanese-like domain-containing protein [Peribacillus asahii]